MNTKIEEQQLGYYTKTVLSKVIRNQLSQQGDIISIQKICTTGEPEKNHLPPNKIKSAQQDQNSAGYQYFEKFHKNNNKYFQIYIEKKSVNLLITVIIKILQ